MLLHLFTLSALLIIGARAASDHWGYPDMEKQEEFPHWGGTCETGKMQSPINLSQRGALKGFYDDLDFDNYDEAQTKVTMVNNGHTIQLSDFPVKMKLEGGPLKDSYMVEQIHLHWWSEHTVESIRYPLEAHIVHRNRKYANMTEAAAYKDGIAVIGVLFHSSNEVNDAIDDILENLDDVKDAGKVNKPIKMKNPFVVEDLMPEINGYFTYPGSLTTPSCAESVTWIVLQKSFPVTLEQIERFEEIEYDDGKPLSNNYRFLQAANNRPVVIVSPSDDGRDAAIMPSISLITLIVLLLLLKLLQ